MLNTIIIILVCLLFSAFFSGMEIAFVSANKLRFELDRKAKKGTMFFLNPLIKHPQQLISTLLVGNNIALVVYGLQMAILLEPFIALISTNALFVTVSQTIVATILILFTGEFLPKTIFRVNPNLWLNVFAFPLWFFYYLLYPIALLATSLSVLMLRIIGIKKGKDIGLNELNRTDLDYWVQESIDNVSDAEEIENEVKIFQKALDFSSVKLKDCMVPRTEVVAFDENTSADELKSKFIETGYSKIPIYRKNIDNVIGYIHSSEMFKKQDEWQPNINTMPIVPETMHASKLLAKLMKEKKSMAVVVDEFGGTSGIVTLEDIMEEIFGEIEDEHDTNRLIAKKIGTGEFLLSGRLEIDTVNRQFGLDIAEDDSYVTIAGYILHHHQDFPKINDRIEIENYLFRIVRVANNKIELVQLKEIN